MKLTVHEVARRMGVSEAVVFRWIERERLPASRFEGQFRLQPASVYEWATARGIPIRGDLFGGDHAAVSLVEALRRGGVVAGLRGDDRESVLRAAVARVELPEHADREVILQMLLARERLGSSALGQGIAIPHVRNPIVLRMTEPQATLFLLEHAIDFGAHDSRPVHALFLLFAPTTSAHLTLLSQLAFALLDDEVCAAIAARKPADEILRQLDRVAHALGSPSDPD